MPKTERILLQVRLSQADKQRIKSLASRYGFTLEQAVPEAFAAWAEKMRIQPQTSRHARAPQPALAPMQGAPEPVLSLSKDSPFFWANLGDKPAEWLEHAFKLDWSKCPEVELVADDENRLWMIRDSEAPLKGTLRAVAEGIPLDEICETLEVELPRLQKVLEFAIVGP
jgi:hypothetical protein